MDFASDVNGNTNAKGSVPYSSLSSPPLSPSSPQNSATVEPESLQPVPPPELDHSQLPYKVKYQGVMRRLNPYVESSVGVGVVGVDDVVRRMAMAFRRGTPTMTARGGGFQAFHFGQGNGSCVGTYLDNMNRMKYSAHCPGIKIQFVTPPSYSKGKRRSHERHESMAAAKKVQDVALDPAGGRSRILPVHKDWEWDEIVQESDPAINDDALWD